MRKTILFAGAVILISACGGNSNDNSSTNKINGLKLPSTINVAQPKNNTIQTSTTNNNRMIAANATDPGTDYSNDPVDFYSGNNTLFNLDVVNDLLCVMDKLRVTELVNHGAYVAKINDGLCSQDSSNSGQSNASTTYTTVTVLSQRTDNQSPQIVKMWLDLNDPYLLSTQPGAITPKALIEVIIRESVSNSKPFGVFDLNESVVVDASRYGGNVGEEMVNLIANFRAYMTPQNKPRFDFIDVAGKKLNAAITDLDFTYASATELTDSSGDAGRSRDYSYYVDPTGNVSYETSWGTDFNATHILTATTSNNTLLTTQCLSRTDFYSTVWSYNLYHSADGLFRSKTVKAGERVNLNTSIDFMYNGVYGSINGRGYWLGNGGLLPDQASVKDYTNGEIYTVHLSPGKLESTGSGSILARTVQPTDTVLFSQPGQPVTLYCYSDCPKGGMTQDALAGTQDAFYPTVQNTQTPYTYTLTTDGQKIFLSDNSNGNALVDFSQLDLSALPTNYIYSGPMYTQSLASNPNIDVYYYWFSGPDQSAQLATLTDSDGQIVSFDSPTTFNYTHSAGNDRYENDPAVNTSIDTNMYLVYDGPGQLYGFSYYTNKQGVDVPASLNDGLELQNDEGTFITKATAIAENSVDKAVSECAALDAETVLNDTGLNFISQDNTVKPPFTAADQPIVNDPPKVIDGVIQ